MTLLDYAKKTNVIRDVTRDEAGNVYLTADPNGDALFRSFREEMGWVDEDTVLIPAERAAGLRQYEILLDEEACRDYSVPRRPYYRMRGRPVTAEQAFDLIRRTDNFFASYVPRIEEDPLWVGGVNFDNWLFERNHFPSGYGWVHGDGAIGGNAITQPYPEIRELVWEWFEKLYRFPYLDLVIALTDCNEAPPGVRPGKDGEDWDYDPGNDSAFLDSVRLGICVHDKTVELMGRARALAIYEDYRARFERDRERYVSSYYQDRGIVQTDAAYLKRCIASYGLDPEEILKKIPAYVWQGLDA